MGFTPPDKTNINNLIITAIEKELKARIELKYEDHKKLFLERLDKDKAEILAGITLWMMNQIDMQSMGEKVIITLRTETK